MSKHRLQAIHRNQEGHAEGLIAPIIAGVGAILLGIGAAGDDMGWLAITGGILAGIGMVMSFAINHATIEKGMYGRLDKLDGNK